MRSCFLLISALGFCACTDATGTLIGGEPLDGASQGQTTGSASGTGNTTSGNTGMTGTTNTTGTTSGGGPVPTFDQLYAQYFNPLGTNGKPDPLKACGAVAGSCHQESAGLGVATSGFICGFTAMSCWSGMTHSSNALPPSVPPGGAPDATKTPLYKALYKGGDATSVTTNNMPFGGTYLFTMADLAKISAWIQNGAPAPVGGDQ
jgi:hypothetical protein